LLDIVGDFLLGKFSPKQGGNSTGLIPQFWEACVKENFTDEKIC